MTFNTDKSVKIYFFNSILMMVIGYFLWTILIPIQDFHLMTEQEVLHSQKQFAINYPLGKFLLYLGFINLITSSLYFVGNKIKFIIT